MQDRNGPPGPPGNLLVIQTANSIIERHLLASRAALRSMDKLAPRLQRQELTQGRKPRAAQLCRRQMEFQNDRVRRADADRRSPRTLIIKVSHFAKKLLFGYSSEDGSSTFDNKIARKQKAESIVEWSAFRVNNLPFPEGLFLAAPEKVRG